LEKLGLDKLDTNNFYFRSKEGSKKARREMVSKEHKIIMLFGDNLADFTELFDKKSVENRNKTVDSLQSQFGDIFIVLPNVLYGEWESSLFEYKYDFTEAQKDSIRMNWIKGY
jgi:5'-nucleotidase (lipoprotein e(P4) family)